MFVNKETTYLLTYLRNVGWKTSTFFIQRLQTFFTFVTFFLRFLTFLIFFLERFLHLCFYLLI